MKYNKLVNIFVFCVAMQPVVSFGSQESQDQSYWQQYAPQKLQDLSSYVSQKTKDAYNAVNNWSTKKKIIVASAIIVTLAALYNREQILQWVSDAINNSKEEKRFAELVSGAKNNSKKIIILDKIDNEIKKAWQISINGEPLVDGKKLEQLVKEAQAAGFSVEEILEYIQNKLINQRDEMLSKIDISK